MNKVLLIGALILFTHEANASQDGCEGVDVKGLAQQFDKAVSTTNLGQGPDAYKKIITGKNKQCVNQILDAKKRGETLTKDEQDIVIKLGILSKL
jgi:hypothetical protein